MIPRKLLYFFAYICLQIIGKVKCEDGISLAFAIDDSRSMFQVIDQVKIESKEILNMVLSAKTTEVKDYVLLTINDPEVKLRVCTRQSKVFLKELEGLRLHNYANSDSDERVIFGIKNALEYSRPESKVFILTDASTKELEELESIRSLCRKKQSQLILIIFTQYYPVSNEPKFTVYYDIAKACFGQVFAISKEEVHAVSEITKITSQAKHSVLFWQVVNKTDMFVSVMFTLTDKAEYTLVTASGKNVKLKVTTIKNLWGPNPDFEKTIWNNDTKIVNLINPNPGTYFAWIKADSNIAFAVYKRTDFTFEYHFSTLDPKYLKIKQPISDLKHHMSIDVTDIDNSVEIVSAHILDTRNNNDTIIKTMPLRSVGENKYVTEDFLPPKKTFQIMVEGRVKRTNQVITKRSRSIDPVVVDLIPQSIPVIKITEGRNLEVKYGSAVTLTCTVTAHPDPKIEWFTSSGKLITSHSSKLEDLLFVSYLKLDNIKRNESYVCKASNKIGYGIDGNIKISVRPIFTRMNGFEERSLNVKYGEDVNIPCHIKSYLPIKIRWFQSGKEIHRDSDLHISPDGSELTIKGINIKMQGKYTCEVTLTSDPAQKDSRNVDVKIPGLARPEILSSNHNISIIKGAKIELPCKIIRGYPKPQLQWFKTDNDVYMPLYYIDSDVLTVNNSLFTNAGQYKCEAINVMGTDAKIFDVTVSYPPEMSITGTTEEIPYDSGVTFMCNVESYPPPTIEWIDQQESILKSTVIKVSENKFVSKLDLTNIRKSASYTCQARNKVGVTDASIKAKVAPPFQVKPHMKEKVGINYGSDETLECDIKSVKPMEIRWYKQAVGVKSGRFLIKSSKKYNVSEDGTNMTINSMDMNTEGKYTCEASLLSIPSEKLAFHTTVKVVGLLKPEVTYSTAVSNNKNFTIICRFKGVPEPTISWQFKAKDSEQFRPIPGFREEINIPDLRLKHSGVYKCIGQNFLGSSELNFTKIVEERPIIYSEDHNIYGIDGDLVMKIPCNVTGFPDPVVTWKKGAMVLNMTSRIDIKGSSLNIKKPVQSDSDSYVCEAKNKLGNATEIYSVKISDSIDGDEYLYGDYYDIHLVQGKPTTIKCNMTYSKEDSIRWFKDGTLTNQTGSVYKLESPSFPDEGNYTCRVNTKEGSKSETYYLNVGHPPYFEENGPSTVTVDWETNPQTLDCSASAIPEPKYEWIHNEKVECAYNMEKYITVDDWGQYTCKVSNVHGTISKSFEVITTGCFISNNMETPNQPLLSSAIKDPTWSNYFSNIDILLDKNEQVKLSCVNNSITTNAFKIISNKQEIIANCVTQDKFNIDGKTYKYKDLQCNRKVEPLLSHTGEQCSGSNSELIKVGFQVNDFLDAYNVCFDTVMHVPLYASSAKIDLRNVEGQVNISNFEWSLTSELGSAKTKIWKPEENCDCCYTKSQLVNVNEMPFGPAQTATFLENLNSIPVWKPCAYNDRISWEVPDGHIRSISLNDHVPTWTGASNYQMKDIGLVPRYLWKVMKDNNFYVMVYVNDAYPAETDILCSDVCDTVTETDTFLYCCSLEEFSKKFNVPLHTFTDA